MEHQIIQKYSFPKIEKEVKQIYRIYKSTERCFDRLHAICRHRKKVNIRKHIWWIRLEPYTTAKKAKLQLKCLFRN